MEDFTCIGNGFRVGTEACSFPVITALQCLFFFFLFFPVSCVGFVGNEVSGSELLSEHHLRHSRQPLSCLSLVTMLMFNILASLPPMNLYWCPFWCHTQFDCAVNVHARGQNRIFKPHPPLWRRGLSESPCRRRSLLSSLSLLPLWWTADPALPEAIQPHSRNGCGFDADKRPCFESGNIFHVLYRSELFFNGPQLYSWWERAELGNCRFMTEQKRLPWGCVQWLRFWSISSLVTGWSIWAGGNWHADVAFSYRNRPSPRGIKRARKRLADVRETTIRSIAGLKTGVIVLDLTYPAL